MTSVASCLLLGTVPAPLRFAVSTREASYGTTGAFSLLLVALHFLDFTGSTGVLFEFGIRIVEPVFSRFCARYIRSQVAI
jgi:hypothetical protein